MGCKLSPLLANVFMSDFEEAAGKENYFPRVWKRYVDDVFAPVKERYLPQTLDLLNSRHNSIKFTVEREVEGKLPFLDLMITRKEDGTLKFGIYRKPTSTDRYITSDSNHFGGQKQAAFHAMAHRLFNVPMEAEEFAKEQQQIYKAAEINGYDKRFVDKILGKQKRKQEKQQITTLLPGSSEIKRISLPVHQFGVVVTPNENTLRDLLCNLKDKVPPDEHSGIYRIPCQNCPSVYIGQTRHKVKVRIKEHKHAVDNAKSCESSVAAHTVTLDHQIDWKNAKIIKNVRKTSHLNAWESLHISNSTEPLMNEDDPPITSCLFNILKRRIP
ncbi:uncharacterized protein LOC129728615 [Wyeomyia smithii]|uniref:uncharacterized protein LOC129728615 n=1 Tax=Wyeomyia smithii TaxID=174621 RepID=UPI002467F74E|nr:uncharacterized protein LOC129728615 [Wyeomyia smithii]